MGKSISQSLTIDLEAIDQILDSVVGGVPQSERWHLYSNDSLLRGLLFTILGNTVSARLYLSEAGLAKHRLLLNTAPSNMGNMGNIGNVDDARARLLGVLRDALKEKYLNNLFMVLPETPDPNVALGTPFWTLGRGIGSFVSAFMRGGRREELSQVRHLQQRPEIEGIVKP